MIDQPKQILIETERLKWRQFDINDADFLIKLFNSQGWIENIGDRKIYTQSDAVNYINENFLPLYEIYKYGFGIVLLKV